jgi:acetylglutamate kinase
MSAQTICIKIGGSTVSGPGILTSLADAVLSLQKEGHFPVIVHGGGKDIARQLELLDKEYTFIEGMRVTDSEAVNTVQMVLSGQVNKRIVNSFVTRGIKAVGISGVDAGLFEAVRMTISGQDIGFVGTIDRVDTGIIDVFRSSDYVPVISPISRGSDGAVYNVNADMAASELAVACNADHLIFISDVPGVMVEQTVRREIRISDIRELISQGHITGGMVPKLRSAAEAVSRGVGRVHICGEVGALAQELEVETSHGTVIY